MVRSILSDLCAEPHVGLYVELDRNVLRCSVTVAESEVMRGYIRFEVAATGQWERRLADWIVNYWSCMVEELIPVGVSCSVMPSLRGLMEGANDCGSVLLDPLRLESNQ